MAKQNSKPKVKHPPRSPEQRALEYQRYRANRKANADAFKKDLVSLADGVPFLFTPCHCVQASITQLKNEIKDLTAKNAAIRKVAANRKRRLEELESKQHRSSAVFNALTSTAAAFRAYFVRNDGIWNLFEVEKEDCDKVGNMQLREWVRKGWPRKISKLLGNQSFERAFTFEGNIEPMSSDDEGTVRRRRKQPRNKTNKNNFVHLTDVPGSEEEEEMECESESESEAAYQCYDARTQTWWIEKGRQPGRPKTS